MRCLGAFRAQYIRSHSFHGCKQERFGIFASFRNHYQVQIGGGKKKMKAEISLKLCFYVSYKGNYSDRRLENVCIEANNSTVDLINTLLNGMLAPPSNLKRAIYLRKCMLRIGQHTHLSFWDFYMCVLLHGKITLHLECPSG